MKTLFPILITLIISTNCKSSKLDAKIPFQIKKATYQYWTGGQPGVHGIKIELLIANLNEDITLQDVYFKNNKEKLYLRTTNQGNSLFTANFNTSIDQSTIMILHNDPKKEYGNALPNKINFPKNIEENQCVISYLQNNKEFFYTVNLTKEENVSY